MPLVLVGRTKDAVVSAPAAVRWEDGVVQYLRGLTDDEAKIERHLDLLQQRAAGQLPWRDVLIDGVLPNGRPMPPSRRYAEMLVNEERLPLYEADGLRFSLDLHNPGNEAEARGYEPEQLEFAIVGGRRLLLSGRLTRADQQSAARGTSRAPSRRRQEPR